MRKLIVVTGGSRGIGRAIIERFAAHDFDAVTCGRDMAALEALKHELSERYPNMQFRYRAADMSDRAQVEQFGEFVKKEGRPVDVLVNNAGYFVPGEICTEPDGTLESMMGANLYSAYYTTRVLVQDMKERKAGHIFNICSIASLKAYANGGSYAITKFALLGFSKCLREELKPYGIRVTAVMPGATRTRSWDGTDLPDERFMPAEDVAETLYSAYSLSERSVVEEIVMRPLLGDI